jgi:hypothetical protein
VKSLLRSGGIIAELSLRLEDIVIKEVSIGFLNLVGDSIRSEGLNDDSIKGRKGEDCGEQELAIFFSIIFSGMLTG